MLIFPSYYRRERPQLVGHPAALVSYRFNGFLDEIYATLVVRLHPRRKAQRPELGANHRGFVRRLFRSVRSLAIETAVAARQRRPTDTVGLSCRSAF
jgi:hypothetical protein